MRQNNRTSFLKSFPNSSGAYSLRQLSQASTDVMRVRRSSDNAEQDFNANEVKGSVLSDWVNEDVITYTSDYDSTVSNLTAISGAVITQSADNPYSGTYSARIALTGGDTVGFGRLTDLPVNSKVRVDGFYRTDGVSNVNGDFGDESNGSLLLPATSSWTAFSLTSSQYLASGFNFLDLGVLGTADGWIELDNVTVTSISGNGYAPKLLDQRVPTSKDAMYFDGVDDYVLLDSVINLSTNNFKVDCYMVSVDGVYSMLSDNGGNRFSLVLARESTVDKYQVRDTDGSFYTVQTNERLLPADGSVVHIVVERTSATQISVTVDGTTYADKITIPSGFSGQIQRIGQSLPNSRHKGLVYDLSVTDSGGTSLIEWDGTINNAISQGWSISGTPQRVLETDVTKISRDFSQSTAGSQPQIIDNGALVTENTKPVLDFNGTTSHLRCPASEFITPTTALQVSVACKNNSARLSGDEVLIGQYDYGANKRSWAIVVNADENLQLAIGDPLDGTVEGVWVSDNVISPNNLQTIGFKYNAGTVVVYVNGVEVSGSVSTGSIPATLYNSDTDATIGCSLNSNTPVNFWDGQIGEAYIADNLTDDLADIQLAQMKAFNIS